MSKLHLAQDLSLPQEAVTEKLAFLGRTGSGKTYAAQKLAEEMYRARAQFIALDPVGKWYALRLLADGKSPGLAIPVFGGLHGDIPLEPTGGKLMADVIVDRGISAVVDVSQFESDAQKARFMTDFGNRFFFRKKAAPSAVHLFIEEAQEFVPQHPQRDEALMLHAWTRLQKLGRNFGIGSSLISQRPQEVNKKVLNLTEVLFVFQLTGPQERKAVAWWIEEKGIEDDIAAELPKLQRGCPHVWSPGWLQVSRVIRVGLKETFDASSTPKVGSRQDVRDLAPIDLARLQKDMAATIERAKQEDPRELRKQVADLRAEVARLQAATPATRIESVKVPVVTERDLSRLETAITRLDALRDRMAQQQQVVVSEVGILAQILKTVSDHRPPAASPAAPIGAPPLLRARPASAGGGPSKRETTRVIPDRPHQRILDTILMLETRGIEARRESVARWMRIHPNGGRFNRSLADLRQIKLVTGLTLTKAGLQHAQLLGTGVEAALAALKDDSQRRMLGAILEAKAPLSKDELAERLGIHPNGGRFNRNLAWLRDMGLIPDRGPISPSAGALR